MSADVERQAAAAGRHLFVRELRSVIVFWVVFVIGVALIAAAIATLGTITSSVWEKATQAPRWFSGVWGIYQTAVYLPLFIAHGYTRREFAGQVVRVAGGYAVVLSVLITAGFALEWAAYRMLGWPQVIEDGHLFFSAPTELHLVLVQYVFTFFAWIAVGALVGAAFYRYRQGGWLTVPIAFAALSLVENVLGADSVLYVGVELTLTAPTALAVYSVIVAGALSATWFLISDLPMRTTHS